MATKQSRLDQNVTTGQLREEIKVSRCDWHRKQPEADSLMEGDRGGRTRSRDRGGRGPEQGQEEGGARSRTGGGRGPEQGQ